MLLHELPGRHVKQVLSCHVAILQRVERQDEREEKA